MRRLPRTLIHLLVLVGLLLGALPAPVPVSASARPLLAPWSLEQLTRERERLRARAEAEAAARLEALGEPGALVPQTTPPASPQQTRLFLPLIATSAEGATTHIGPSGGTVRGDGGSVEVVFPPGALPTGGWAQLTRAPADLHAAPGLGRRWQLTLSADDGRPIEHTTAPVSLRVAQAKPGAAKIVVYEVAAHAWRGLATTYDHRAGQHIATASSVGTFSLLQLTAAVRLHEATVTGGQIRVGFSTSTPDPWLHVLRPDGSTAVITDTAVPGLFELPASGGIWKFHLSDGSGNRLSFAGYALNQDFGYRVDASVPNQPLWVGQGAASDAQFQAFLAKYRALGGAAAPGLPDSALVHQWDGFVIQGFQAPPGGGGSVLIQNPERCGIFQVRGDVLGTYLSAGGPGSWLGPPVRDEITAPPEYTRSVGQPLGLFKHGIITRADGAYSAQNYYPQIGQVTLSVGPADPTSGRSPGSITVVTRSVPGQPGTSEALSFTATPGAGPFSTTATDTYATTLTGSLQPATTLNLNLRAVRAGDGREVSASFAFSNIVPERSYGAGAPIPPDPSAVLDCSLPIPDPWPPADTTPPVIGAYAVIQDGQGGVIFTVKVTDDRAVARVTITLDGKPYEAGLNSSSGLYELVLHHVDLGTHAYSIDALDTAGNPAVPVSDTFKLERSDSYGVVSTQGYSTDPVNTLIGNFIYSYTDLDIPEPRPDLEVVRFYNAQSSYGGRFGRGWTTIFDMGVLEMDNALFRGAIVRYPDGRTANFAADGSGGFLSPQGGFDSLARDGSGYRLTGADQTSYSFDAQGRLLAVADTSGNTLRAAYSGDQLREIVANSGRSVTVTSDAGGRVTKLEAPEGISLSYSYDAEGRLQTMSDGNGATVTYHYDGDNGIARIESPEGHDFLAEQEYDDHGRVTFQRIGENFINRFAYADDRTTITDSYDRATVHVYDSDDRLIEVIDAQPASERYTYNDNDQRTSVTDRNGHTTSYEYDPQGNRIKEIDHLGGVASWTYDAQRRMTSATDKRGNTTEYSYDGRGRLIAIVNPLRERTEMRYNAAGQIVEQISPRGASTTYSYDDRGLLVAMRDDLGAVTRFSYDAAGRRVAEVDPNGNTRRFLLDASGNLLEERGPLGGTTSYRYDRNNNRLSETDASGATTEYGYSQLGKLLTTTYPDGGVETLIYDDMGNQVGRRDPLGNTTTWTLDAVYRKEAESDPLGATTRYTYDRVGNRTSVTDARGFTTRYEYDTLNRIERVIDPFGATTTYSYDQAGNLVRETGPLGAITTYAYDELNRLKRVADPVGAVTEYAYDGHGNRVAVTDALGNTRRYEYDTRDQLIRETDALGRSTRHSYDPNGNRVATEDARGFQTLMSYDALDRLVALTDALGHVTRYSYDAVGNRTAEIDPLGATTRLAYDPLGRLVEQVDPLGQMTRISYDLAGHTVGVTDANGSTTVSRYDAAGRLIGVADPLGYSERSSYDASGNVVERVDKNGIRTHTEYDALNRIVAQTDGRGATTRFRYDLAGNEVARIDAAGQITRYAYDAAGRLVETVDALGSVTHTAYDALGQIVGLTRPDGSTLVRRYDAAGQLTAVADGSGLTTTYSYDEVGNQVAVADPGGQVVTTSYDALRRPLEVRDGLGLRQRLGYDAAGNRVAVTDGAGFTTSYAYDLARRQVGLRDAAGRTLTITYDTVGNQVSVTAPDGATAAYSYDRRGQLVGETDPNGNRTRYGYDGVGRRVEQIDAMGVRTRWAYDQAGNLAAVTLNAVPDAQPDHQVNITTRFSYDPVGNRTSITDPNGHTTTFSPDPLGRLAAETDPLGNRTVYVYDSLGREIERREPNGRVVLSAYDRGDRLVETHYVAEGERVQRGYNAHGQMVELVDGSGTTSFSYDERGRLVAERSARGEVRYVYDNADRRSGLVYPDGAVLSYIYGPAGDLERVVTPDGATTVFEHDGAGRVVRQLSGNGAHTELSYDPAGNVLAMTTRRGGDSGPVISGVAYRYDAIGQRSEATYTNSRGGVVRETYAYDALRRLVGTQTSAGVSASYAYDAGGNRTRWASSDDPRTGQPGDAIELRYSYDAADQLTAMSGGGATVSYSYDASGNRVERLSGGARTLYRYDSANRLVELREQRADGGAWRDSTLALMERDGLGRRVARSIDDLRDGAGPRGWAYSYAGLDPISTLATRQGVGTNLYRAEAGRLLAQQTSGASAVEAYYAQDGLDSTLALSDAGGRVIADYRYDSYGIPTEREGATSFTYTGQEYDAELGLYHFHARAYDPETATWLSRDPYRGDPADPQSLHRYGYVQGNPVNLRDAYGYAAQGGTYGKAWRNIVIPEPIKFLFSAIKEATKHDLMSDMLQIVTQAETNTEVSLRKLDNLWKILPRKKLFQRSLIPETLRDINSPVGKFRTDFEYGADWDLTVGIESDSQQLMVSMCASLSASGAFVASWPSSNPIIRYDLMGGLKGDLKGCVKFDGYSFDKSSLELNLTGFIGGRIYAELDARVAGARAGVRVEAGVTFGFKWQGSLGESIKPDSVKLGLEIAGFYGYKYLCKDWEDHDLVKFGISVPIWERQ